MIKTSSINYNNYLNILRRRSICRSKILRCLIFNTAGKFSIHKSLLENTTQLHKREKTMNMQNGVLYMGGILDSWGEFSGSPELPATTIGAALVVPTVLGSTPVVLGVTVECETEVPDNPETGCWESVDAIGVTEAGLEASPFDVKEGFKLAALAAVDVVIDETTALGVSLVSDCIPWFAAFCAWSRANWRKYFNLR